ncbi:MAG: hypothetical protein ACTSPY_09510 [Candidatus Helarchaeota archaeon]
MKHRKIQIYAFVFAIAIMILPIIEANGLEKVIYNVNIGTWVDYNTTEYFRSKIIINGTENISHNETASYKTKITITGINYSKLDPGVFNNSFGIINGTISAISMGQTFQEIQQINVGPFLGFFYPVINQSLINQTMNDFNGTVYAIYINLGNLSSMPSEIRYFLNPTNYRKVINLSASLRYLFYNTSYGSITFQPAWYMNALAFNCMILNFTLQLNISSIMNVSYNQLDWKLSQIQSQLSLNYIVYIDIISGVVLNMKQTGDIIYYESTSANVEPYFGLPYNFTMYLRKEYSIQDTNAIIFTLSYWIWIIILVILSGVGFVILYLYLTSPKRTKKEQKYVGNILED